MIKILVLFIVLFSSYSFCQESEHQTNNSIEGQHVLWYQNPATTWMEALPVGNGRLGAMVFGEPYNERIQLNEDSMWPGGPDWENSKGNVEDLESIRKLIREGNIQQADKDIVESFSYKSVVKSTSNDG